MRTLARMEALTETSLPGDFEGLFGDAAEPDSALANFERWLRATTAPGAQLESLLALPPVLRLVLQIIGSSQPLADALIQNP